MKSAWNFRDYVPYDHTILGIFSACLEAKQQYSLNFFYQSSIRTYSSEEFSIFFPEFQRKLKHSFIFLPFYSIFVYMKILFWSHFYRKIYRAPKLSFIEKFIIYPVIELLALLLTLPRMQQLYYDYQFMLLHCWYQLEFSLYFVSVRYCGLLQKQRMNQVRDFG